VILCFNVLDSFFYLPIPTFMELQLIYFPHIVKLSCIFVCTITSLEWNLYVFWLKVLNDKVAIATSQIIIELDRYKNSCYCLCNMH
jgi:hypothetical protein